ncbi:MAG: hypothetical protein M1815_002547 [Lichina confinis]|nr:MAG: hypothetical protein M1815_002547 [Lichina confinis]
MSTFMAVNSSRSLEETMRDRPYEVTTPTTPRPTTSSAVAGAGEAGDDGGGGGSHKDETSLRTPTRDSFVARMTTEASEGGLAGATDSQRSSWIDDGQDVAMDESEDDEDDDDAVTAAAAAAAAVSETEDGGGGGTGSASKTAKKKKTTKKGQRFFCKEFPPCNLSFTRSEHLARHIRKHTGERPFQCHCARRFSRLDNLRQHAQTVHVNEDIPTDSLAATGTRFQRQVRTERMRPTSAARSRASTIGGGHVGGPARGHSRNLSASSITSTASSIAYRDEGRPRPPPLAMAAEISSSLRPAGLSLDTFRSPPESPGSRDSYLAYMPSSPAGLSTPTSATFSTGPGSPRFSASLRSPVGPMSPSAGFWAGRTPARRLSVPSGTRPMPSSSSSPLLPVVAPPGPPYGPVSQQQQQQQQPPPSSSSSTFSPQSSVFGSPTSSIFSLDSVAGGHHHHHHQYHHHMAPDVGLKRRTWHPESRSTFTSPLANSSVAYAPREQVSVSSHQQQHQHHQHHPQQHQHQHQHHQQQPPPPLSAPHQPMAPTRLPGIESFGQLPPRPATPPRRGPSPMQIDSPGRPHGMPGPLERSATGPDNRGRVADWDMSLHRNLNRLGIHGSTDGPVARPPDISSMVPPSVESQPQPQSHSHSHSYSHSQSHPQPPQPQQPQQRHHPQPLSFDPATKQQQQQQPPPPPPETPRKNKRHGWYNGPLAAHRPSPESSGSEGIATPSTSSVVEANPSIRNSNGWFDGDISVPSLESQKISAGNGMPAGDYSFANPITSPSVGAGAGVGVGVGVGVSNQPSQPNQPNQPSQPNQSYQPYQPYQSYQSYQSHAPPAPPPPPPPPHPFQPSHPPHRDNNMLRLEALVAVATSEK